MDLNQIKVYITVVEAGSFSSAAGLLDMPRSTVSRKVSQLENALGSRLLQRSTRKLSLTDAGQRYYAHCRDALTRIEQANESLLEARRTPSGTLRIAAPLAAQNGFMCDWINEFAETYEDVSVEVMLSDDNIDLIDERIDVSFRAGKMEDSNLVARKLGKTRLVLCASPDYLDTHADISSLRDLKQHDCIYFGKAGRNHAWRLRAHKGIEHVTPRSRIMVNSMEFVLQACLRGLGVAVLPVAMIAEYVDHRQLQLVLPQYTSEADGLYLLYPSRKHLSPGARAFVEFVVRKSEGGVPWERLLGN